MQTNNPRMHEEEKTICSYCESGPVRKVTRIYFSCPTCESIYRILPSGKLERLNVNPVSDVFPYPEVILLAQPPYCDCELKEYLETLSTHYGPRYCPKHNIISLGGIYRVEDIERMDKVTEYILIHEGLHWLLGKFVCEEASFWLDNESVSESIDNYLFTAK